MKRKLSCLAAVVSLLTILSVTTWSQKQVMVFAEDHRPFDFSDKYYESNGIIASTLVDRKSGADGQSVFDKTDDPRFTEIRITATLPAYTGTGETVYWNYYGSASKASFTNDAAGGIAVDLAYTFPMYVFPSKTVPKVDRQAAMIRVGDAYFNKNQIGIATILLVEFTDRIFTKPGHVAMQMLAERNGLSIDGTPIIRTAKELEGLSAEGLVTVTQAGSEASNRLPFAVTKVIQHPELGGIAPDAFLLYTKEKDGTPLASEAHFISKFECYRGGGPCF